MIRLGEATGDTEETGDASGGSVASVGRSIGEITGESDVIGPFVIGLGEATGDTEETGGASGGSVATVGRSIGEITGETDVIGPIVIGLGEANGRTNLRARCGLAKRENSAP